MKTITHQQDQETVDADITGLLNARIIHSERLRAAALVVITAVFVVIIAGISFLPGALPEGTQELYRPALRLMAVALVLMSIYEAIAWHCLGRWQRTQRSVPDVLRFLNALVEITTLTLVIWNWSAVAGPLQTVGGVLPYLYFPFIAVSALHLNQRLCWFVGVITAVCFCGVAMTIRRGLELGETSLLLSPTSYYVKSILMLVCGVVAAFVAGQLKSHLLSAVRSARDRDRAVSIFGQHVSPQVARRLIEQHAGFSAEQRHVCVLFLDIRGFSAMAAERTPAQVMDYLNTLFAPMITLVNQHGGIVNKFLGDGFMAIFGAPFEDPELHRNAVRCAFALLESVEKQNAAGTIPATRIGIGIHAGSAMAGTVGNQERKEYTLLGDTVNAAARIEQETKKHSAQIIVSDAALDGLPDEKSRAIDLGEVTLRGISQTLRLYRLA